MQYGQRLKSGEGSKKQQRSSEEEKAFFSTAMLLGQGRWPWPGGVAVQGLAQNPFPQSEAVARLPEPLIALLLAGSLSRNAHPMALCPPLIHHGWLFSLVTSLNPQGIKNPCSLLERIPGGQGQPVSHQELCSHRGAAMISNPPGPWPPSRALEENSPLSVLQWPHLQNHSPAS